MRILKYCFTVIGILFFTACSPEKRQERVHTYFDLQTYFEQEIARLAKENPELRKTALNNDHKETKSFSNVDWRKELGIFAESDINKPAWKNSYSIDTVEAAQLQTLIYKAKENSLTTRYISVTETSDHEIKAIEIRNITINNLYASTQVLKYIPGVSYYIIGTQKVKILDKTTYGIIGRF